MDVGNNTNNSSLAELNFFACYLTFTKGRNWYNGLKWVWLWSPPIRMQESYPLMHIFPALNDALLSFSLLCKNCMPKEDLVLKLYSTTFSTDLIVRFFNLTTSQVLWVNFLHVDRHSWHGKMIGLMKGEREGNLLSPMFPIRTPLEHQERLPGPKLY